VIQVVIGVAAALALLPVIAFCLSPRSVRAWFEGGPDAVDAATPAAARAVVAALREMGFQPLGVRSRSRRCARSCASCPSSRRTGNAMPR
jgi:hypothetical protein